MRSYGALPWVGTARRVHRGHAIMWVGGRATARHIGSFDEELTAIGSCDRAARAALERRRHGHGHGKNSASAECARRDSEEQARVRPFSAYTFGKQLRRVCGTKSKAKTEVPHGSDGDGPWPEELCHRDPSRTRSRLTARYVSRRRTHTPLTRRVNVRCVKHSTENGLIKVL